MLQSKHERRAAAFPVKMPLFFIHLVNMKLLQSGELGRTQCSPVLKWTQISTDIILLEKLGKGAGKVSKVVSSVWLWQASISWHSALMVKAFLISNFSILLPSLWWFINESSEQGCWTSFYQIIVPTSFFHQALSLFLTFMLMSATPNIICSIAKQHAMLNNWINTKTQTASPCLFIWKRLFNLLLRFPEI